MKLGGSCGAQRIRPADGYQVQPVRLTHNAVSGFRRAMCPFASLNSAHRHLKRTCREARFSAEPPQWLEHGASSADGYLLLPGEVAALPVRRGRAIALLVDPRLSAADVRARSPFAL